MLNSYAPVLTYNTFTPAQQQRLGTIICSILKLQHISKEHLIAKWREDGLTKSISSSIGTTYLFGANRWKFILASCRFLGLIPLQVVELARGDHDLTPLALTKLVPCHVLQLTMLLNGYREKLRPWLGKFKCKHPYGKRTLVERRWLNRGLIKNIQMGRQQFVPTTSLRWCKALTESFLTTLRLEAEDITRQATAFLEQKEPPH